MKRPLLLIAVLVLIVVAGECVNVEGAPAILVLDHGLAKNFTWTSNGHIILINRTSTFTQDDARIYAYIKATFYTANLTWNWYDPTGQLYDSGGWTANCVASPCDEILSMTVSGTRAASMLGMWRVDFLAGGALIYSDYFWLTAIVTQYDYWNFTVDQSPTPHVHGSLRVVIHPPNGTWSYYRLYMPNAFNITAYDYSTMQPLAVMTSKDSSSVVISLGGPKPVGYSFILKFDVSYVVQDLGGGNYVVTWREFPWERYNDIHTIPEAYNITLPNQVVLLDVVGYNSMGLRYNQTGSAGRSLGFVTNLTGQSFGWTILYRNISAGSKVNSYSTVGPGSSSEPLLPLLPISVGGLSVWSAVMSVFLLTASELVSPIYSRSGYGILISRKRLRLAALLLIAVFVITITYQLTTQHVIIQR